jgi:uncharacterized protein
MKKTASSLWYYIVEMILLFVLLPVLYYFDLIPFHKVIPLIGLVIYCAVVLIIHKPVNPNRFSIRGNWIGILIRFVVVSVIILVFIKLAIKGPLWSDLNANRKLLYMMIMYPFLSAFSQELIFREFFFYRYTFLFKKGWVLIVVNVVLFSFAHLYFASWIVLMFTLIGGAIFALTYVRTRSLLVVTIEHSLYGLLVLASSLGMYFYKAF